MPTSTSLLFKNITTAQSELLVALLAETGFEGFEESETELRAFISSASFDEAAVKEIAANAGVTYELSTIEETNWNAVWESNFSPVIVDDFLAIRADFHEPVREAVHEIIITPKMSFGTGHHATTYMMVQQMRAIDFTGKTIFDFGTGTGVLAILAEMLGAENVVAIDNDDWSIENATENCQRNNCTRIELQKADTAAQQKKFDIILANINKNVILDNIPALAEGLAGDGVLLLSGLLEEDKEDILRALHPYGVKLQNEASRNNWICLSFSY